MFPVRKAGWFWLAALWVLAACRPSSVAGKAFTATPAAFSRPTATPTAPASPTPSPSPDPSPAPELASPTPAPSPTPDLSACMAAGGRMEKHALRTDLLPQELQFRIYLPPCYDQLPERHYPVLYLLHGQSFTDDQWDRLGADETADRLIAAGEIPPFLIVMPRDRVWKQPSEDPFGQAVVTQLVPFIDQFYRTLPDRRFRAIGGLSRGASWAVHLGLSRWDLFGAIGAHSLPVFFEDVGAIDRWLEAIPPEQWPRIWLDIGDHDTENLHTSTAWFESRLTAHGIPHEYYIFPGWHNEAYWGAHVSLYLRWYAADW